MASIQINIDDESGKMDKRFQELSEIRVNPPGSTANEKESQRSEIGFWQGDILAKQHLLDTIKSNKGAALVTIKQIKKAEVDAAISAMATLNIIIRESQSFDNIKRATFAMLAAAETVVITAAK